MTKKTAVFLLAAVLVLLLAQGGCRPAVETGEPDPFPGQQPQPGDTSIEPPKADPAAVKVDETGKVMILMYHVIGAEKEAPWKQTAANFRRDLLTLYNEGYSLCSLGDFVANDIRVAAGRTPVIITFDDASAGQFRYLTGENGKKEIDPECAVGIMLDFAEKHPDFGCTATFYINENPFDQKECWKEKLQELVELGFDIGNHTLTHPKLNQLSDESVQKELAGLARLVEQAVPGYQVDSLALPHGISPQNALLAVQGEYMGYRYHHRAVLKVGANPAVSPATRGFDPLRLPRVQASTVELEKWLNYFRKNPAERYVSDGDPSTITIPRGKEGLVDKERIKGKELVVYP
ncbi:MAG: polysaccharide deacetylase family protein [Peptococcaceae bacterium]|jgi:hypothetical protein|nr:polysaccharide deacetylase family protein [Peptococcaceae bacterium]MDH7525556.1 polysaccharide deacetylase family protein [Peptococcaceae bacterium]